MLHTRPRGRLRARLIAAAASAALTLTAIAGAAQAQSREETLRVVTGGQVTGNFFGNDAAALAGIATFSNRDYDTAFGGTKD